ncbi:transposase [Streptomyces sp. NPDC001480]|uniref:transposase n=1 Tax=Streptomyces sp. NPDC001480 TaxID=3364577 RepID=UPI003684D8F7
MSYPARHGHHVSSIAARASRWWQVADHARTAVPLLGATRTAGRRTDHVLVLELPRQPTDGCALDDWCPAGLRPVGPRHDRGQAPPRPPHQKREGQYAYGTPPYGCPRCDRQILEAIVHVACTGQAWSRLPPALGPFLACRRRFLRWHEWCDVMPPPHEARAGDSGCRAVLHSHGDHGRPARSVFGAVHAPGPSER